LTEFSPLRYPACGKKADLVNLLCPRFCQVALFDFLPKFTTWFGCDTPFPLSIPFATQLLSLTVFVCLSYGIDYSPLILPG